jgi:hypothetical protein
VPSTGKYEVCVWSPQKTTATTVQYRVTHTAGSTLVSVDQRHFGGRWYRLGDFDFQAGQGTVTLTNQAGTANRYVMADAVKATKWPGSQPDCSPGDLDCDQDVDQSDFGHLQGCLAAGRVPASAECLIADLYPDLRIDQQDLTEFVRCYSGANIAADPNCIR